MLTKTKKRHEIFKSLLLVLLLFNSVAMAETKTVIATRDNNSCDIKQGAPLTNGTAGYGPFDVTDPANYSKMPIVLGAHFTREVEQLISGSRGTIASDLDYTLRALPNYPRALAAMARFQRSGQLNVGSRDRYYTADCYFKRALYLQPNDAVVYSIFGMHLHLTGRHKDALKSYQNAFAKGLKNPEVNYNLALLYLDMKMIPEATEQAKIAYAQGVQLPGLRNKLKKAGVVIKE